MKRECSMCGQPLPKAETRWEFELALEPPSQNTVSGNKGAIKSRSIYRRIRDSYELMLRVSKNSLDIPDATARRRVFITRLYTARGKKRDRGNIVGGCKGLVDAMANVGLLVDDKEEFFEGHYGQERGDVSGVRIQIDEVEQ